MRPRRPAGQALIIDIQGESREASRETSVESRGQLKKKWLVASVQIYKKWIAFHFFHSKYGMHSISQ
jgi:hypothetical protein